MTKTKLTIARLVTVAILIVSLTALSVLSVALADEDATPPQTRAYNDKFDKMLDDLTGTDGVIPAYRHVEWTAGQANSVTNPIYKIGSASLSKVDSVTYVVRSENTRLANLKLGFRHSDHDKDSDVAVVDLSEYASQITFSGSNSDIGSDWVEMTLLVSQWDGVEFACKDDPDYQGDSELNTGDTYNNGNITGLHLFSDGTAGSLDIQRVEIKTPGGQTLVLQNFAGKEDKWWDDSAAGTYTTYGNHYEISGSKQIVSNEATSNNMDSAYDAIVLVMSGSGSVTVAPVTDSAVGTPKAWANLTDLNGTALPALSEAATSYVISLNSLGEKAIKGVEIAVDGGSVLVYSAFFTNMEELAPGEYPLIDVDSISYMTLFNYEYHTLGKDYDKAVADCAEFNMWFLMSYGDENARVKVTDGHLVFDSPEVYTNAKILSKVASDGAQYLVLKYKLQNGATLDNFRFAVINAVDTEVMSDVVYANQMMAAVDKLTWSVENPYYSASGYSYLVIDMELTFGDANIAGLDMYYSGAGQMMIEEIFYADACYIHADAENAIVFDDYSAIPSADSGYWWTDLSDPSKLEIEDGALKVTVPAETGVCIGGAKPTNNKDAQYPYMIIRMKGDLGMDTFRIAFVDGPEVYYNQDGFVTINGKPYVMTDEYTDFIIDLAASGINPAIEGFRLWVGGWNSEAGVVYIDSIMFADKKMEITDEVLAEDFGGKEVTATAADYAYIGWASGAAREGNDVMILEVEGDISQLRLEMDSQTLWFSENAAGTFVDAEGNVFALSGKQTLVIDLNKSGVAATVANIHFHNTFAAVGDVLKITSLKFASYGIPTYDEVLATIPVKDDSKPVIDTFDLPATAKVGDEITVTVNASDVYTSTAALQTVITYTINGVTTTVTGSKFTVSEAGTYTVTVTVTDAAGNVATQSKTLTVTADGSGAPSGEGEQPNDGLSTGAIVGIAAGSTVAAGGLGVGIWFLIKKRRHG